MITIKLIFSTLIFTSRPNSMPVSSRGWQPYVSGSYSPARSVNCAVALITLTQLLSWLFLLTSSDYTSNIYIYICTHSFILFGENSAIFCVGYWRVLSGIILFLFDLYFLFQVIIFINLLFNFISFKRK